MSLSELNRPIERMFAGFSPLCSEAHVFPVTRDHHNRLIDRVVEQYHRVGLNKPVVYRNYHGVWIVEKFNKMDRVIEEFIENAFKRVAHMDASRALTGIALHRFKGLPLSGYAHLIDIQIDSVTNLGDGLAMFVDRQWVFTQRKGRYKNTAHLYIKQRK